MNKETKPSAGALRAAFALMREASQGNRKMSDLELMAQPVTHRVAQIIDRETGLAELLEAARDAKESLRHAIADAKAFRDPHADKLSLGISISSPWKLEMREERHAKLVAAIAKAEAK